MLQRLVSSFSHMAILDMFSANGFSIRHRCYDALLWIFQILRNVQIRVKRYCRTDTMLYEQIIKQVQLLLKRSLTSENSNNNKPIDKEYKNNNQTQYRALHA
jgi:hypothetical protein